jgi:hypothetical protein
MNKIKYAILGITLLTAVVIISFEEYKPLEGNLIQQKLLGDWKVTMLDGSIKSKLVGPAVPLMCDDFTEYVFKPVVDHEETFIKLLYRKKAHHLKDIPMEVYDTLNVVKDEKGLFLFQFGFDNGYHTNKVLEAYGEQYHRTELIKGLWSFEVGFWNEEGVRGESITGTKWGGKSSFTAVGRFVNDQRIEGQWIFEETATLPGIKNCVTKAYGDGHWVAEKK